jgi:2-desacetyl-2-hydroxyethyl bacteriochlorophyllide A dehydrogenase
MSRLAVVFEAPRRVAVVEEPAPSAAAGEVLVSASVSAISAGTELLIYRGEAPPDLAADATLPALAGTLRFPLRYGYAVVGEVVAAGAGVDSAWRGRRVFAFQPHHSRFACPPCDLLPIPEGIADDDAVFLPNVETAVNLLLDAHPRIGERAVVFGQGIVGLLTTALLAGLPLARLVTADLHARRRALSLELGADESLDPSAPDFAERMTSTISGDGADLALELSGSPAALDQAVAATGFGGRVVIGSWYGRKPVSLDLGGRFHRSRIRLVPSQVSSLAPELSARWSKTRRLEVAWEMLRRLRPSRLVSHRLPLAAAARAYELLDRQQEESVQVLFEHPLPDL